MRIAQVAPLYESVPPKLYGGTERVVSYLTEELVKQGHEVTLFATGDSITGAQLVASCPRALRLEEVIDPLAHHVVHLEGVFERAAAFDFIHFHVDYLHFPLSRRHSIPQVTTLHGRLDMPDLVPVYRKFSEMPLVSISDAQRQPLSWAKWQATVYHGMPTELFSGCESPGHYLAFLGRIAPEKRVDRAIEIAKRAGIKLRIAAKVDAVDREYMDQVIRPLLNDPNVEFIGEIGEEQKQEFLANAYALIFPIDWPEPFGLVLIEAMACGTPVIAYRRGSVPELVADGLTGFIVEDIDEAISAVEKVEGFDRKRCREIFEKRFSVERMACDYLRVYRHLMKHWPTNGEDQAEKAQGGLQLTALAVRP
jgi:glycosyltransferase involved in cell wall biosynthesis